MDSPAPYQVPTGPYAQMIALARQTSWTGDEVTHGLKLSGLDHYLTAVTYHEDGAYVTFNSKLSDAPHLMKTLAPHVMGVGGPNGARCQMPVAIFMKFALAETPQAYGPVKLNDDDIEVLQEKTRRIRTLIKEIGAEDWLHLNRANLKGVDRPNFLFTTQGDPRKRNPDIMEILDRKTSMQAALGPHVLHRYYPIDVIHIDEVISVLETAKKNLPPPPPELNDEEVAALRSKAIHIRKLIKQMNAQGWMQLDNILLKGVEKPWFPFALRGEESEWNKNVVAKLNELDADRASRFAAKGMNSYHIAADQVDAVIGAMELAAKEVQAHAAKLPLTAKALQELDRKGKAINRMLKEYGTDVIDYQRVIPDNGGALSFRARAGGFSSKEDAVLTLFDEYAERRQHMANKYIPTDKIDAFLNDLAEMTKIEPDLPSDILPSEPETPINKVSKVTRISGLMKLLLPQRKGEPDCKFSATFSRTALQTIAKAIPTDASFAINFTLRYEDPHGTQHKQNNTDLNFRCALPVELRTALSSQQEISKLPVKGACLIDMRRNQTAVAQIINEFVKTQTYMSPKQLSRQIENDIHKADTMKVLG